MSTLVLACQYLVISIKQMYIFTLRWFRYCTQNWNCRPHGGGAIINVKGLLNSVGFILWGPWVSRTNSIPNSFYSCSDILIWTKVVNQLTDRPSPCLQPCVVMAFFPDDWLRSMSCHSYNPLPWISCRPSCFILMYVLFLLLVITASMNMFINHDILIVVCLFSFS